MVKKKTIKRSFNGMNLNHRNTKIIYTYKHIYIIFLDQPVLPGIRIFRDTLFLDFLTWKIKSNNFKDENKQKFHILKENKRIMNE